MADETYKQRWERIRAWLRGLLAMGKAGSGEWPEDDLDDDPWLHEPMTEAEEAACERADTEEGEPW